MTEGDVRIVRVDSINLAVQKIELVQKLVEIDGKRSKGGTELRWVDKGYYGRLDQAARCAVTESCGSVTVTPELVEMAVQKIIEGTRSHLGVKDPTRTRQP